jgi:tRNA 2-thiouridine synthesizing protein A
MMTILDARGLLCPLPLTMAKRRMADLRRGETLLVLATDPEAPIDLAAWASEEGHDFSHDRAEGWLELRVRKCG